MDKMTHKVREEYWRNIVKECCNRPKGMTAKQWLEENDICEQSYYGWQKRFRMEAASTALVQSSSTDTTTNDVTVSFAELPYSNIGANSIADTSSSTLCNVGAIVKCNNVSIALSDDISERLLSLIMREVSHA